MKKIGHWTPRYLRARLGVIYYQNRHADHPWLTWDANKILISYLKQTDCGVEFGSGRSSIWFAKRIKHLTSVEHNETWFAKVQGLIEASGLDNIDYRLCPRDKSDDQGGSSQYVQILNAFEDNSKDFILIDGIYRDHCALKALRVLRPGGLLVLDNIDRDLPCPVETSLVSGGANRPATDSWRAVEKRLSSWRVIWTSCGIWDTAIYIKPCA